MRIDLRERPLSEDAMRHRKDHVLLDGEDVTACCFLSDEEEGIVGLFIQDESGHFYRDPATDDAAREYRFGKVTLVHMENP